MASFTVAPPIKFSFRPNDWPKWIKKFERFRTAPELDQKSEETQVATLIYSKGEEADEIFNSFTMTSDDRKKYDVVKAKFEGHFIIERNVIFERAKFNLRVQKENEPVDTFISDLFTLAQHCNYGNLHAEMVRDRIVVGLKDKSLSEKLQLETLEYAINQARQRELVRQQQEIIRQEGLNASNVDKINHFGLSQKICTQSPHRIQMSNLKTKNADAVVVACTREMSVQPNSLFVIVAKEKDIGKSVVKQNLWLKYKEVKIAKNSFLDQFILINWNHILKVHGKLILR